MPNKIFTMEELKKLSKEELLNLEIETLPLSVSIKKYINRFNSNIKTLSDLLKYERKVIESIRNIGKLSFEEISKFIHDLDLQFIDETEEYKENSIKSLNLNIKTYNTLYGRKYRNITDLTKICSKDLKSTLRICEKTANEIINAVHEKGLKFCEEIPNDTNITEDMPIGVLNLSNGLYCKLRRKFTYIKDITSATEEDILKIRSLGVGYLNELKTELAKHGFKLFNKKQINQEKKEKNKEKKLIIYHKLKHSILSSLKSNELDNEKYDKFINGILNLFLNRVYPLNEKETEFIRLYFNLSGDNKINNNEKIRKIDQRLLEKRNLSDDVLKQLTYRYLSIKLAYYFRNDYCKEKEQKEYGKLEFNNELFSEHLNNSLKHDKLTTYEQFAKLTTYQMFIRCKIPYSMEEYKLYSIIKNHNILFYDEIDNLKNIAVASLTINVRLNNCLLRAKKENLLDIVTMNHDEAKNIPNMRIKDFIELESILSNMGLSFSMFGRPKLKVTNTEEVKVIKTDNPQDNLEQEKKELLKKYNALTNSKNDYMQKIEELDMQIKEVADKITSLENGDSIDLPPKKIMKIKNEE